MKMKRMISVFLALVLGLSLGVCALGEEAAAPSGRVDIPDFDAADWIDLRPIRDERDAIAYAKAILALPLLGWGEDTDKAEWTAEWEAVEEAFSDHLDRLSVYEVTATLPEGRQARFTLYAENGGARNLFCDDWNAIWEQCAWAETDPGDPWRAKLWRYAVDLLEAMEPGVSQQFQSLNDGGDYVMPDGSRFVILEFWIAKDDMRSKVITLQVWPVLRLVEAYTGQG